MALPLVSSELVTSCVGEYAIHVLDANGTELPGSPFMAQIKEAPARSEPLSEHAVREALAQAIAEALEAQLPARHEVLASEADRRSPFVRPLELLVEWPTAPLLDEWTRRLPSPTYENLHSLLAPKLRAELAVALYSSSSGSPLALNIANEVHKHHFECRPRDTGPHVAFVSLDGHPLRNSPCHVRCLMHSLS